MAMPFGCRACPGRRALSTTLGDPIAQWDRVAHRWLLFQNVFTSPYCRLHRCFHQLRCHGYLLCLSVLGPWQRLPRLSQVGRLAHRLLPGQQQFRTRPADSFHGFPNLCLQQRKVTGWGRHGGTAVRPAHQPTKTACCLQMWTRQPLRPQVRMSSILAAWEMWTILICPCTPTTLISRIPRIRSSPAAAIPNWYPLPALPLPATAATAAIAFRRRAFRIYWTHLAIA